MDFPHVIATVYNRLSSLLDRDLTSFKQLITLLWEDEEPYILTYSQLLIQSGSENINFGSQYYESIALRNFVCPKCNQSNTCLMRCVVYDLEYIYNPFTQTAQPIPTPPHHYMNYMSPF